MIQESDPKRLAQIALVVLLIIGCIALLLPFIGAILFAFVVWICTWPLYAEKLLPRLGGRNIVGASLMTLALILVLLLPTLVMAGSLANGADNLIDFLKPYIEKGLPNDPPGWLVGLPFFGSKAVGEPPFMLAISVWEAIRDAVAAARGDGTARMDAPATAERVLGALKVR